MADEEPAPAEESPPEDVPPVTEEAPVEEAPPPVEENPDVPPPDESEAAPPPADETPVPVEDEALPETGISKTVIPEEPPPEEIVPVEEVPRVSKLSASSAPQKEITIGDPAGDADFLHNPEIEVLEADGMIEEIHVLKEDQAVEEEDYIDDEASMERSLSRDDQLSESAIKAERRVSMEEPEQGPEEMQLIEKSNSLMDILKDSSMDVGTKKELLEKKKQRVLGSIISIRRGDPTYFDRQKAPKFQNSYKLDSDRPFNHEKVEQILQEVLEEALQDLTYDPDKCSKQAKWASSAIRAKVKEQEFDRYKIICYVSIGEKLCQDVFMMMRFLWDAERDQYALYVHENMNLFGIGLCFGIYYE